MQHKRHLATIAGIVASLAAPAAGAHATADHGAAFLGGLGHPLLGLDHVLAMLAVGLWAAQQGGRARWQLPSTFLVLLVPGVALGLTGAMLPVVDAGAATSVLILGLLLALAVRMPRIAGLLLVGVFAVLHGYAHGVELGQASSLPRYGAGFLLAALGLQLAGLCLGARLVGARAPDLLRASGMLIAGGGLAMWA